MKYEEWYDPMNAETEPLERSETWQQNVKGSFEIMSGKRHSKVPNHFTLSSFTTIRDNDVPTRGHHLRIVFYKPTPYASTTSPKPTLWYHISLLSTIKALVVFMH